MLTPNNILDRKNVPQFRIDDEAELMIHTFIVEGQKPPRDSQWRDKYKTKTMKLLWECHCKKIPPPLSLVMLSGCLLGDRHDWPTEKFSVLDAIATKYKPLAQGESLPRGLITFAADIYGQRKSPSKNARLLDAEKGSEQHDYRKTIKNWFKDELFCFLWEARHEKFTRAHQETRIKRFEAIEKILSGSGRKIS